jgi:hypothetical protein
MEFDPITLTFFHGMPTMFYEVSRAGRAVASLACGAGDTRNSP